MLILRVDISTYLLRFMLVTGCITSKSPCWGTGAPGQQPRRPARRRPLGHASSAEPAARVFCVEAPASLAPNTSRRRVLARSAPRPAGPGCPVAAQAAQSHARREAPSCRFHAAPAQGNQELPLPASLRLGRLFRSAVPAAVYAVMAVPLKPGCAATTPPAMRPTRSNRSNNAKKKKPLKMSSPTPPTTRPHWPPPPGPAS